MNTRIPRRTEPEVAAIRGTIAAALGIDIFARAPRRTLAVVVAILAAVREVLGIYIFRLSVAARILGCSPPLLQHLDKTGKVPLPRINGRRYLTSECVMAVAAYRDNLKRGRPHKVPTARIPLKPPAVARVPLLPRKPSP